MQASVRSLLVQSLLSLVLLVACLNFFQHVDARPPNILFILADDLGYGDLGTYPNPNTTHGHILTPRLDALAAQSMRFTDAYAGAPVCAPSRCAFMTGKHTGHCTVRANGPFLNASDVTVGSVLQKAGYRTAIVGKWGLGDNSSVAAPNEKGFDFFYGYTSQQNAHNYYPPFLWLNRKKDTIPQNQHASRENCGSPLTKNCVWAQDLFVNKTMQAFDEFAGTPDQPFFLFLSFTTPHAGGVGTNGETGVPAPEELQPYSQNLGWPEVERDFASVITLQDQQVGMVLDHLKKRELDNNTVVFYASDNGAHNEGHHNYQFFDSSGPLRGYKRSLHEGGFRSPLLVRWPNVVTEGTVSNQQWGFWDFLETAADIAGIQTSSLPANDGYSLVPTLKGMSQDQPQYNYVEYCHPNEDTTGWGQTVRFGDWKALRLTNGNGHVELYNLATDLGETTDISSKYPDEVVLAVKYMDEAHVPGNYCNGH